MGLTLAETILAMAAAGCSVEQVAKVAAQFKEREAAATEARRAKEREKKRIQRGKDIDVSPIVPGDIEGHEGTSRDIEGHNATRAGIYNHARADGNLNPLTTFGDISSPSANALSPQRPEKAARSARCEFFERFWNVYPRKQGRKAAFSKFQIAVRSGVDPEHLVEAAERFAEAHRLAGTEKQFIPYPATWLHHGRYDDEDLPTPFAPSARAGPAPFEKRTTAFQAGLELIEEYREQELRNTREFDSDEEAFVGIDGVRWS